MRSRIVNIVTISIVVAAFVVSVHGQTVKSASPAGPPIKVGGSLSLSGVFAENGNGQKEDTTSGCSKSTRGEAFSGVR